ECPMHQGINSAAANLVGGKAFASLHYRVADVAADYHGAADGAGRRRRVDDGSLRYDDVDRPEEAGIDRNIPANSGEHAVDIRQSITGDAVDDTFALRAGAGKVHLQTVIAHCDGHRYFQIS